MFHRSKYKGLKINKLLGLTVSSNFAVQNLLSDIHGVNGDNYTECTESMPECKFGELSGM